jgi:hypothetical protein
MTLHDVAINQKVRKQVVFILYFEAQEMNGTPNKQQIDLKEYNLPNPCELQGQLASGT